MINLTFELNNQPMSAIKSGTRSFAAFSGLGSFVNKRSTMCLPTFGSIPIGSYSIFDRQSGGLLGPLRDLFNDHSNWFALYAIDGKIDDQTYCNKVRRGAFRIHPKGFTGRSEGCVVIDNASDYLHLKNILKSSAQIEIPGIKLKAYGCLVLK